MRILVVGSAAPTSLESSYLRALQRSRGVEVAVLDTSANWQPRRSMTIAGRLRRNRVVDQIWFGQLRRALERRLTMHTCDVDAVLVFKGVEFDAHSLRQIRRARPDVLFVNINPDDPFVARDHLFGRTNGLVECIPLYDVYFTWGRHLVPRIAALGCPHVEYLPFAYDPTLHFQTANPGAREPDRVAFVGTWDPGREAILSTLVEFNLHIFGGGWDHLHRRSRLRAKVRGSQLYFDAMALECCTATVCLNLLRPQNTGSHNMRTFEIPAVGALMLTTRSLEQDTFFPENDASLMYGSGEELRDRLEFALRSPGVAASIRQRGQELVRPHTYDARCAFLLDVIRAEATARSGGSGAR